MWSPHKKMSEIAEMSGLLEVNGDYYRILRNTLDQKRTRKILVCQESGRIEKDIEINRKCFKYFDYIGLYALAKWNMKFDQKQSSENKHVPLIEGFRNIIQELNPILSRDEQDAMNFHLYYLEEIYRLSVIVADLAFEVESYRNQLYNLERDRLSAEFMHQICQTIRSWRLHRKQIDAMLIEDGERARPSVKKILKTRKYKKKISNWRDKNLILKEMQEAKYATKRYINAYKKDYDLIEVNLGKDKGSFSIKKLIYELREGIIEDEMRKMSEKNLLEKHWVLSENCIFK